MAQTDGSTRQAAGQWLCDQLSKDDLDSDGRWWAYRALAKIPAALSQQKLLEGLLDSDPGVRQCAALGLRKTPDPGSIPGLIRALNGPDPLCADLAADTLIAIGEASVPALVDLIGKDQFSNEADGLAVETLLPIAPGMRARRALALISDPQAVYPYPILSRPTATIRS